MKLILFLTLSAILVLFSGLFRAQKMAYPITLLTLLISLGMAGPYLMCHCEGSFYQAFLNELNYEKMIRFDRFATLYTMVIVGAAFLVILMSGKSIRPLFEKYRTDIYGLMLFSLCGALMLVSYTHLVILFLGIEILSIPLYVLAGSRKNDPDSNEAAFKYFMLGSIATAIMLFGMALLFGSVGSFEMSKIMAYSHKGEISTMFQVGTIILLCGMAFKVGLAPFHFWGPDVYEGSPSVITAFMATVVKTAGFGAMYLMFSRYIHVTENASLTIAGMGVITMFLGNLSAIRQTRFKRMLAWSSIAHAGYLTIALISPDLATERAILLYMAAYSLATVGAFSVMIAVRRARGGDEFNHFNGLGKTSPLTAFILTLCLVSLAGIPLTAGFMSKYYLFSTGWAGYPWMIVLAVINSAISIYYYFKAIIAVWMKEEERGYEPVQTDTTLTITMIVCSIGVIILGLFPQLLLQAF